MRKQLIKEGAKSNVNRDGLPIGTVAPNFTLSDCDGKKVSLHDFRGQQTLLVFSGPQCYWCMVLAPKLQKAYQHPKMKTAIVMVSTDAEETRKKVEEYHLTFPVTIQNGAEISRKFQYYDTPAAFLLDEEGVIVNKGIGENQIMPLLGFSRARRRVMLAAGLAGLGLMLGRGRSLAQEFEGMTGCGCGGVMYNPHTSCCFNGMILPKEIGDLALCPGRVVRPGYDGCGAGQCEQCGSGKFIGPNKFLAASFLQCCRAHDRGWNRCGNGVFDEENGKFAACVEQACRATYGFMEGLPLPVNLFRGCMAMANTYIAAISGNAGFFFFEKAQREGCICCPDSCSPTDDGIHQVIDDGGPKIDPPPCPNPGTLTNFCGRSAPTCGPGPQGFGIGCFCTFDVDGRTVCVANGLCRDTTRIIGCDGGSCPPGHYCVETCCAPNHTGNPGRSRRCMPVCGSVGESVFEGLNTGEDFDDAGVGYGMEEVVWEWSW